MRIFAVIIGVVLFIEVMYLGIFVPLPSTNPIKSHHFDRYIGTMLYMAAYVLSVLRLPFIVIPYLSKLLLFFTLRRHFKSYWNTYPFQAIRTLGDFINLLLVGKVMAVMFMMFSSRPFMWLILLVLIAESIRLASEKGQMVCSALWQLLPHRKIAHHIQKHRPTEILSRYCHYYALDDIGRTQYVLCNLKTAAHQDLDMANRLEYLCSFRIVPHNYGLRCEEVRDVARGEVFIHRNWTNDPWLLIGLGLRRAPWMFDPRYLQRPFYYRTQSNRLATLFVLRHARYSPLFAWYQLGHEIKVARYDLFYRVLRLLGFDIEKVVREDGTHQFDSVIDWLAKRLGIPYIESLQRPLSSDEEVIEDITTKGLSLSAMDIALHYTYPLKYVEEVLIGKVRAAATS